MYFMAEMCRYRTGVPANRDRWTTYKGGQLRRFYCINVPRFDSGPNLRVFTILLHSRVSKELSFVVVALIDRYRHIS